MRGDVKITKMQHEALMQLVNMTVRDMLSHIKSLSKKDAWLLLRAMQNCTATNCWWAVYDIAIRFQPDVQARLDRKG